jgi:DNA primase
MDVIEVHPWNATVDDIEHPDQMVLDLDPGHGISWEFVTDTAIRLRDILKAAGLECWPKLTGGKGVHVMVPLAPNLTHDELHQYARELAQGVRRRTAATRCRQPDHDNTDCSSTTCGTVAEPRQWAPIRHESGLDFQSLRR